MRRMLLIISLLAGSLLSEACAPHSPAHAAILPAAANPIKRLREDLDRIFSDRRFANARWGVEVFSLDRSEKLYERDASGLYIPASNNKLITVAVALMLLGPDYRYETRVLTDGQIENGVLRGNLIIVGTGDPFNSPQFQPEDPFATFKNWAAKLKERNVQRIAGDIVGDGGAFDETKFGFGWEWNDLGQAYAAPVGALQFHDNVLSLEISPGSEKGELASIKVSPLAGYLAINSKILTEAEGTSAQIKVNRGLPNQTVVVSGSIPLKGAAISRTVSVLSPAHYYLWALRRTLAEEGIDTAACEVKELRGYGSSTLSMFWTHSSPILSELLKPLLKASQNLYAETLARTLGLALRGEGTFAKGREVVEEALDQMGVEKDSYVYADGSGLSRLNLTSPDALVKVLRSMHRRQQFRVFFNALPIAGIDGTLAARLKNTRAENNVHAKTGSMANVSAISGYMRTAENEMLAFSILANNFLVSRADAESLQDKALERLANFSRK